MIKKKNITSIKRKRRRSINIAVGLERKSRGREAARAQEKGNRTEKGGKNLVW